MFLTLEARVPCVLCGYRLRYLMMRTCRINKRSIRSDHPGIVGTDPACPECLTPNHSGPPDRWRLIVSSQAEVDAYRARKWPEAA